eukprot:m.104763 g.104763  ORF g.104763 m.104763 type:complete len:63 (+) comp27593_c0_seq2:1140-1328(+)
MQRHGRVEALPSAHPCSKSTLTSFCVFLRLMQTFVEWIVGRCGVSLTYVNLPRLEASQLYFC